MKPFQIYALLMLAGGIGAAGDALLNQWVKTDRLVWLGSSVALWIIAVLCFALLLKCQVFPFGAAVVLGLLVHCALAVVFDRIYFGGRLSFWQWMGICLGVVAIVLVGQGNSVATSVTVIQTGQEVRADRP